MTKTGLRYHLFLAVHLIGIVLIISGIALIFLNMLIITSDGVSHFDLLGLPIPTPPIWFSYIPYYGSLLGQFYEMFSWHGLVEIVITATLIFLGVGLNNLKVTGIAHRPKK